MIDYTLGKKVVAHGDLELFAWTMGRYISTGDPVVELLTKSGEVYARASTNLSTSARSERNDFAGARVHGDGWIKTWSENEWVLKSLLDAGVVRCVMARGEAVKRTVNEYGSDAYLVRYAKDLPRIGRPNADDAFALAEMVLKGSRRRSSEASMRHEHRKAELAKRILGMRE